MSTQSLCLPSWDLAQPLPKKARLFIGLWPTVKTVSALQPQALEATKGVMGRALAPQHWHITLAFLGQVTDDQWQQLIQQIPTWEPIALTHELTLDRLGYFRAAQVLWLGMGPQTQSYHELQRAHQQLWQSLGKLGFKPVEQDYVPHMSLLRQAQLPEAPLPSMPSIRWQTSALKLILSLPSSHKSDYYSVLNVPIM